MTTPDSLRKSDEAEVMAANRTRLLGYVAVVQVAIKKDQSK